MLEYKRSRSEFPEADHELAREITEAVNAYLNEAKGDKIRESLDVGIVIAQILVASENREDSLRKLFGSLMLVGINAGFSSLEKDDIPV